MLKFRYHQILPDGVAWASQEAFDGELGDARQGVLAGFQRGQPRAAVEEGTCRVLHAVDKDGVSSSEAVALFGGSVAAAEGCAEAG